MNSKIIIAWLLALVMMLGLCACGDKTPDTTEPEQPTTDVSLPDDANNQTAFLGRDLYITHVGNYTGAYMEDGSDEVEWIYFAFTDLYTTKYFHQNSPL